MSHQNAKIRVGIVDDHQLIRKSLSLLVGTFDDMEVTIEAENGRDLLEKLKNVSADILLLDLQMPEMDGFETCVALQKSYPDIKILIITQLSTKESVHKALGCGAHGYFTKNSDPAQLESAIRNINEKGFYFENGIGSLLHDIIFWENKPAKPNDPLTTLSERELEIIRMIAGGMNNSEIAEKLFINVRTVETHRKHIMEKASVKNFTAVILLAIKFHYLTIAEL